MAGIAARQHGVVSHAQLIAAGLTRAAIAHRVRCGQLHRIHVGVYAVGHPGVTLHGRWAAAVLAYGPGSLLSHRDAAALWGVLERIERPIDVLIGGRRMRRPGLVAHRTASLHPDDRAEREGIPLTSLPRTLLDLCDVAPRSRVGRAFDEADRLGLLEIEALEAQLARSRGRRGLGFLAELVSSYRGPAPKLRSRLEQRFLALCREAGLPEPETNVQVEGFEVDVLWREARVVVELDGYAYHRSRAAFEADRRRDGCLIEAGLLVRRITHRQLEEDAAAEVASLVRLLDRRAVESTR